MHGNNKSTDEIRMAAEAGVGHLILDSFDEIERCESVLDSRQDVLIRVTPGIRPSTHDSVQTGQLDSKFGFGLEDGLAAKAVERVLASSKLNLVGLHAHIGSQIFGRSASWPATGAGCSTSAAASASPTPQRTSRLRSRTTSTSRSAESPRCSTNRHAF
jgi:diaminopimelate decarboxylase